MKVWRHVYFWLGLKTKSKLKSVREGFFGQNPTHTPYRWLLFIMVICNQKPLVFQGQARWQQRTGSACTIQPPPSAYFTVRCFQVHCHSGEKRKFSVAPIHATSLAESRLCRGFFCRFWALKWGSIRLLYHRGCRLTNHTESMATNRSNTRCFWLGLARTSVTRKKVWSSVLIKRAVMARVADRFLTTWCLWKADVTAYKSYFISFDRKLDIFALKSRPNKIINSKFFACYNFYAWRGFLMHPLPTDCDLILFLVGIFRPHHKEELFCLRSSTWRPFF